MGRKSVQLEMAVYKHYPGIDAYKARIRTTVMNLKDKNNPGLKEAVGQGEISIEKFAIMSTEVKHF